MKKIVLSLGLMLSITLMAINTNAQISGGIKAEANMSNFILSDMDNVESKLGFGASLGGFARFDFSENFALQPELLFHFKSSTTEIGSIENDYRFWGAEIPVYALGKWNMGNGKCYVGLGPYVGLGFSAKYDNLDLDLYEKDDITDKSALQRFDFGFGAMLGYEFGNGIQINAGYKIGIIDALDAGKDDANMLPQTISLGIGYRF